MGFFGDTGVLRVGSGSLRSLANDLYRFAGALPEDIPESAWSGPAAKEWTSVLPLLRGYLQHAAADIAAGADRLSELANELADLNERYVRERAAGLDVVDFAVVELVLQADAAKRRAASSLARLGRPTHVMVDGGETLEITELTPEGGLSARDLLGLTTALTGIADPTPISDGVSGLVDLSKGDFVGVGLAIGSMIPYIGDAAAKPTKLLRQIEKVFPALKRVGDLDVIRGALKHVDLHNPGQVNRALGSLNHLHRAAEIAHQDPRVLARVRELKLPTEGVVQFVPPKNWNHAIPQRAIANGRPGFVDAFGNVWAKGEGRGGAPFEWDVQVDGGLQQLSKDGRHLNVSPSGEVTH